MLGKSILITTDELANRFGDYRRIGETDIKSLLLESLETWTKG